MAALDVDFSEALSDSSGLDDRLARLRDGFEEVDGCVVLSRYADSARLTSVTACADETAFEVFVDHVHLEDERPERTPPDAHQQTALLVGRLADEPMRVYPAKEFVVIASIGDSAMCDFRRPE